MNSPAFLQDRLAEAKAQCQWRRLRPRVGVDFSSNDYLGFTQDKNLQHATLHSLANVTTGSAGSRLLRGNLPEHEATEAVLAEFCGTEAALLFPSGYQANLALLSALLREGDDVFSDELNHASIIDGIRLGKAKRFIFPHNDIKGLAAALDSSTGKRKFIVTEAIFSMEGDRAPLKAMAELAEIHGASLLVDESHTTGLFGDFAKNQGGGLVQEMDLRAKVLATMHTGGKALGIGGAWIAGSSVLRDYLVNFSRPFIYSTAIPPALAVSLQAAVQHWEKVGTYRAQELKHIAQQFASQLGLPSSSASPILPILAGSNARALALAEFLQNEGFDIRAIRPPTVPENSARLRITLQWGIKPAVLERLFEKIQEAQRIFP